MVSLINTFLLLYCSFNYLVSPYFAYIVDSFLYHFYPSKAVAQQLEARFLSFLILARDLERFQQYANLTQTCHYKHLRNPEGKSSTQNILKHLKSPSGKGGMRIKTTEHIQAS